MINLPARSSFLTSRPPVPWVEVHSENFFADGGRQIEVIEAVRRDYAVSLHGVGLSLGSTDPLDTGHLARLKQLVGRVEPALVSEHLSWSSSGGDFLNDLLPLPRTVEAVAHIAGRIGRVQDTLGRQILIENVSSYFGFEDDAMSEWDFLVEVAQCSGCLVLLDVNNIYVNACNHGFDPYEAVRAIPRHLVAEIHLAGYSVVSDDGEELLIDTQDHPVTAPVWSLYLPEIKMEVTHFVLERGSCPCCGKLNKASIPMEYRTGYGPRLSAMIAQMAGNQGDSRTTIQEFCSSVLGIPISLGAIQKIIDRASAAIESHYERIGTVARTSEVNHIDETSFANKGKPQWLWVMTNTTVAFLMIHPHRSKEAFETLIRLITLNRDRPDEAGTFARRLHREMDYRWLFPIREAALLSPTMGLTFTGFSSDTHVRNDR